MADHLGDVADSVGPVGGRVTQVRHAAASAQRIVACMTNEHFWSDEFGHPDYARLPSPLHHFLATTAPALFLCECGSRVAPMRTLIEI